MSYYYTNKRIKDSIRVNYYTPKCSRSSICINFLTFTNLVWEAALIKLISGTFIDFIHIFHRRYFNLVALVSGKNIEYSQAVGKTCKRNFLFWKSLLYRYCEPVTKKSLKQKFSSSQAFHFLMTFKTGAEELFGQRPGVGFHWVSLHEKCLNTELFLVRIFPHSEWILRISPYSVRVRGNTDQK